MIQPVGIPYVFYDNPLAFALQPPKVMNFFPVYRLCRSNGSFSRIGSLLETWDPCSHRVTSHIQNRLMESFEQKPGERILLGPRCGPVGRDSWPGEER